ncbi:MAG: FecR domain-containing protein, partial [Magnetococcales bacterium]|nr:FecR domain-containing protein [Magnetococcales bacterium]
MAKQPIIAANSKPKSIRADESVLPEALSMANEYLLPDSEDLLQGEFLRAGDDLVIVGSSGEQHLVEGYFSQDPPPTLKTASGTILLPENVDFLLTANPETIQVAATQGETATSATTATTADSATKADTNAAKTAEPDATANTQTAADSAAAPTTIGKVAQIVGEVTATNKAGVVRVLKDGDDILSGETLATAEGGMIKLDFNDGATFQIGENSSSLMDTQLTGSSAGSFMVSLLNGSFSYASGNSPGGNFTINTPSSVINIKNGTFQAEVGSDGVTTVVNSSGSMEISDTNGNATVTLDESGTATSINFGEVPAPAFTPSPAFIANLNQKLPQNITANSTTDADSIQQQNDQPQITTPTPDQTTGTTLSQLETDFNNNTPQKSVEEPSPQQEQTQEPITQNVVSETVTTSSLAASNTQETSSNVLLLGKVSGTATDFAASDGTATTRLTTLINQNPNITFAISDTANIAQFKTIDALTTSNIELAGGLSDIAAKFSATDGTITAELTAATTQNGAVAITILDTPTVAQINTLITATSGVVTATISGTAASLATLTSSTNDLITVTVLDTPTVSQLNTIAGTTGGSVTATLSGTSAYLADLTTASTAAITITVTDKATVSQFMILDAASSVDIVLTGGLTDKAINFASDSGTVTSGLRAAATQDQDVVITISDTAKIAQFNTADALTTSDVVLSSGLTDTAVHFASTSGTATSGLSAATSQNSGVIITVSDTANIAQFNAIDALTSSNVVLWGGLRDTAVNFASTSGTVTSGLSTATTQDPDVVITVSDTANVAQFNAIDALTTSNVALSSGLTDNAVNFASTSGTATSGLSAAAVQDSYVAITISDVANITQFNTVDALTNSNIVLSGGLTDTAVNFAATNGVATSGLSAAATQDPDVVITISDTANIAQFNTVDAFTTSNVVLSVGLTDTAVNFAATTGTATSGLSAATTQNSDVVITILDAANIAQFNVIDALTTSNVVLLGGLTDTAVNFAATTGTVTSGLSAATTQDPDVVVTISNTANISQFNTVDALTSSNVVLSGGLTDTAVNFAATTGTASSGLSAATTQDPDVVITISDAANVTQFNTTDALTSSNVVLSGGLTDTAVKFASTTGTATSGLSAATTQDPDVVVTVSNVANITQFNVIDALTTSNVVLLGGVEDTAVNFASTTGTATSGLSAATTQDPDVVITITGAANVAQFNTVDALTSSNIVLFGGLMDLAV